MNLFSGYFEDICAVIFVYILQTSHYAGYHEIAMIYFGEFRINSNGINI